MKTRGRGYVSRSARAQPPSRQVQGMTPRGTQRRKACSETTLLFRRVHPVSSNNAGGRTTQKQTSVREGAYPLIKGARRHRIIHYLDHPKPRRGLAGPWQDMPRPRLAHLFPLKRTAGRKKKNRKRISCSRCFLNKKTNVAGQKRSALVFVAHTKTTRL